MEKFHYVKDIGWVGKSENLLCISVNQTLTFNSKTEHHERGYSVTCNGFSIEGHFGDISIKYFKSKREANAFAKKLAELLNEESI